MPTGLLATCIQHEIDHLNGVLFIDHLSKLKRDRVHQEVHQGRRSAAADESVKRLDRPAREPRLRGIDMPLRLVFMGTPDFAVPTLLEIVGPGHEVAAVYTRAPRRPAAAWSCSRRPVEREARRLRHAGADAGDAAARRKPGGASARISADVAVVVAYGLILPQGDPRRRRRSAASICTPRCCRAGAAPRRSTARSWPAMPRPA